MAVTKQKISLTNEDGELNQEYLARLAIFDQIMGKYSPQTCLSRVSRTFVRNEPIRNSDFVIIIHLAIIFK